MKAITLLGLCLSAATAASCGDVSSAEAPGDALYAVPGRLSSGVFAEPEGNYRSVLTWLSLGGGAFIDCLQESGPVQCAQGSTVFETTLSVEPARLLPEFPSRFTLEVMSLPSPQQTLTYKDSVLAFGSVSIYDDRNENGRLDLSDDVGVDGADRLVAKSVLEGVPSVLVFREGPLHPGWKVLRAFGCGDPPLGFSMVVNPTSFRCTVQPLAELLVSPRTAEASARDVCAFQRPVADGQLAAVPQWDVVLNPQAVVTCDSSGESLTYYIDRGNLCDPYFQTPLALRGCPGELSPDATCWDRTDDPPVWWPCPVPM